jgi:hypothetical protein
MLLHMTRQQPAKFRNLIVYGRLTISFCVWIRIHCQDCSLAVFWPAVKCRQCSRHSARFVLAELCPCSFDLAAENSVADEVEYIAGVSATSGFRNSSQAYDHAD